MPSYAAATFTWTGIQDAAPTVPADSQIQGSSYSSQYGLETEATSDTTGGYDLGHVTNGAYAVYKNVDFAGAVATVDVREASDETGGGTVSFYLDSMIGTPIATVGLPYTNGWQNWQTVKAPVAGASAGVHTLYVVFTGGSNFELVSVPITPTADHVVSGSNSRRLSSCISPISSRSATSCSLGSRVAAVPRHPRRRLHRCSRADIA